MADREEHVLITQQERAQRELADAQKEMRENPLDKAKVPGGHFIGTDGEPHDAHGIKIKGGTKGAKDIDVDSAEEELAQLEERRAELERGIERQRALNSAKEREAAAAETPEQRQKAADAAAKKASARR